MAATFALHAVPSVTSVASDHGVLIMQRLTNRLKTILMEDRISRSLTGNSPS
jgi:hypothetical protein